MIEWKGLYANTPYSSANNKTQDDAVIGMQDTIYVTGPGYGGYSASVRIHNASGAVVALIPVSGGGGALSAPAPVRILDDSTTYSYSLDVVRGAVPSDDPDKIVIRIIGGASKRYPGQGSTLPDGSTSFAGPLTALGASVAYNVEKSVSRVGMIGDSLVINTGVTGGYMQHAIMASGGRRTQVVCSGVGGDTPAIMDARFDAVFNASQCLDEIWIGCGTNGGAISTATKDAVLSMCQKSIQLRARPVLFLPPLRAANYADTNSVAIWMRNYADANGIEWHYLWEDLVDPATGLAKAGVWYPDDGLSLHPAQSYLKLAGDRYAVTRFRGSNARALGMLYTWGGTVVNNLVDKPFNTTGSASLAAGYAHSATNIVPTKVACDAPDAGNWQVFTCTINDAAPSAFAMRTVGGLTAGKEYKFDMRFKLESPVNLNVSIYVEWRNGSNVTVGTPATFNSFIRTACGGVVSMVGTAPSSAVSCNIYTAPSRHTAAGTTATGVISTGMVSVVPTEL